MPNYRVSGILNGKRHGLLAVVIEPAPYVIVNDEYSLSALQAAEALIRMIDIVGPDGIEDIRIDVSEWTALYSEDADA